VKPTNLILYGPPGTGKTYATAEEALRLCGEEIPEDRVELMATYRRLTEAGRIEFITFHQSYAYEEFVEGLRPVQGEEDSAGFHLQPELGVLRRVARRAETSTGSGGPAFTIGDRQVFKMSIGRANDPEDAYLFEEAIENGYALIGFDNLDWSDPRFESRDEIMARLKAEGDREGEINPYAGRVQSPDIFRNWVRTGDLIIVSKGNLLFRATGEVVGDYEYAPRSDGTYSHRRAVRWLWVDRAGVPVEEIYSAKFSQRTIYLLTKKELNVPALERYVESQREGGGEPDQFVLIIDEINRANVSKVMGELITLLEPDKRIGATNELRVRLPYSRDLFGLPPNLHLVGTMNTADRSIALLDTALRRRFKFKEVPPEPQLLEEAEGATGLPLVDFLNAINDRIEYLLDREHRIGHAYLINCRTRAEADAAMRNAIIPLLQEYFFEDLSRVAVVLGEPKGGGFLSRRQIKDPLGEGDARDSWGVLPEFAEDAYNRCLTPDTPVHLIEPAAQAAE
jgi:5-methylcytosine-specific restriction protein B